MKQWTDLNYNKCCQELLETEEKSPEKISTTSWPKRPSDVLFIWTFPFSQLYFYLYWYYFLIKTLWPILVKFFWFIRITLRSDWYCKKLFVFSFSESNKKELRWKLVEIIVSYQFFFVSIKLSKMIKICQIKANKSE